MKTNTVIFFEDYKNREVSIGFLKCDIPFRDNDFVKLNVGRKQYPILYSTLAARKLRQNKYYAPIASCEIPEDLAGRVLGTFLDSAYEELLKKAKPYLSEKTSHSEELTK